MQTLQGNFIKLRALEPEDLEFLFQIENNEIFWEVSHTQTPFSKFVLKNYLENAHLDIYETKQLRLIIGILIHPDSQQKGFASEALSILIQYAFTHLHLHQLFANILTDNEKSLQLFMKYSFKKVGIKKEWIFSEGKMKDEILFQLIKE